MFDRDCYPNRTHIDRTLCAGCCGFCYCGLSYGWNLYGDDQRLGNRMGMKKVNSK